MSHSPQTSESDDWLDDTLARARPWISECLEYHPDCLSRAREVPTRLIDVGPSNGSEDPRLIIPPRGSSTPVESPGYWNPVTDTTYKYLCLSYCWGDPKGNLTTTRATLEARKTGIPWGEIPKTIRDAILVTRKLGFRYLWVDALCILQDKSDPDWEIESRKMASVYKGAFLTISAARSPDVCHGFEGSTKSCRYQTMNPLSTQCNPIYQRGWTLQERVLSRRILIFAQAGLYWECSGYEGYTILRMAGSRFPHIYPGDMMRISKHNTRATIDGEWDYLVEDYSKRLLSDSKDMFQALSGLAEAYHEMTGYDYLAGLWRQSLIKGLTWRVFRTKKPAPTLQDTVPSWSWASTDSWVTYGESDLWLKCQTSDLQTIAKVVEAQVDLKDPTAPFGDVVGGFIVLCGPLVPSYAVNATEYDVTADDGVTLSEAEEDIQWMFLCKYSSQRHCGLLLKCVEGDCYERIGFFENLNRHVSPESTVKLKDWGESIVTIV